MAALPDTTSVAALSIPGTHETLAIHGGALTQTQEDFGDSGATLARQLDAGIRMIDIRARVNTGNTFTMGSLSMGAQTLTVNQASARVHHGNGIPADDESNVGDGVLVGGSCIFVDAAPDVYSGGNFVGDEGLPERGARCCPGQAGEAAGADTI